jgi:hypothetical protein
MSDMRLVRNIFTCAVVMVCLLSAPTAGWSAYLELSSAAKKAMDAKAQQAGPAVMERIGRLYTNFLASQKEALQLDTEIKTWKAANAKMESTLRQDIRNADTANLQRLELQLKRTKQQHQPLFDRYTLVNRQVAAARKLQNKNLNSLLRMQAEIMKAAVQLARADIRSKEHALRIRKTEVNRKREQYRAMADNVVPLKAKAKKLKQSNAAANKRLPPLWKQLNGRIRKGDAAAVEASLDELLVLSRQLVGNRREMLRTEEQVASMLRRLQQRLAADPSTRDS